MNGATIHMKRGTKLPDRRANCPDRRTKHCHRRLIWQDRRDETHRNGKMVNRTECQFHPTKCSHRETILADRPTVHIAQGAFQVIVEHQSLALLNGDAFGEVSRFVDVAAELHREMVGEQLEGYDSENRADVVRRPWHGHDVVRNTL